MLVMRRLHFPFVKCVLCFKIRVTFFRMWVFLGGCGVDFVIEQSGVFCMKLCVLYEIVCCVQIKGFFFSLVVQFLRWVPAGVTVSLCRLKWTSGSCRQQKDAINNYSIADAGCKCNFIALDLSVIFLFCQCELLFASVSSCLPVSAVVLPVSALVCQCQLFCQCQLLLTARTVCMTLV